ncbi:MAG: hypothetical protein U0746_05445 [Gemmataceae bacterium]
MLRRFTATAAVAALLVGAVLAADKEIKGKIVKYDPDTRDITVKTADGKDDEQKLGADAKVFDAKGAESKEGTKDKRIKAGADVKLLIPDKARTVKELHFLEAPKADPKAKTDSKVKADPKAKADPKVDAKAKSSPPKADVKAEPKAKPKVEKPATAGSAKFGADAKGDVVKLLKVDVEKRTVSVEREAGKKADYTVADDAKFIGPRGGKADIKDDRFEEGDYVKIVVDAAGKKITEVHLAFRVAEKDEKDAKK